MAGGIAATLLRQRAERERFLPGLREAEWLMLLDLSATEARGRRLTIGDLCHSVFSPPTTTLRHLNRLARKGLIARCPDPDDQRRVFVSLTLLAREKLDKFAETEALQSQAEAA